MRYFTALALIFVVWAHGSPSDPLQLLKSKDKELQSLLRSDTSSTGERKKEISKLINSIFDFQELGRKAMGSSRFKEMTTEQQSRFIKAFQGVLENASMSKIESYKTDSVRYEEPKYNQDKTKVEITAHTFADGTESVLEYEMFLNGEKWKAWDLVIDDLSTYRNYKEQFKRILKTKSIDDLIQLLEDKAKSSSDEK